MPIIGIIASSMKKSSAFIGTLTNSGGDYGQAITFDSVGNIIIAGRISNSSLQNWFVAKYNSDGVLQWQKRYSHSFAQNDIAFKMSVDSSNNIYVTGYVNDTNGWAYMYVLKLDGSGNIIWQRSLNNAGTSSIYGYGVGADSSGNVYVAATAMFGGINWIMWVKYDSAGNFQGQRRYGSVSYDSTATNAFVDSEGNTYITGYYSTGANDGGLLKINSSGTIVYANNLFQNGGQIANGIAVNSSSIPHVAGTSSPVSNNTGFIAKYSSSAGSNISWTRVLTGGNTSFSSCALDAEGNIYCAGSSDSSGNYAFLIAKYNSSGTIQWQRTINNGFSSTEQLQSISVDNSNNLYITGYTTYGTTQPDIFFAKLPTDGSKTGTYLLNGVAWTYAASSLTDASATFSNSSLSLSTQTPSFTQGSSGMTANNASATSYTTIL